MKFEACVQDEGRLVAAACFCKLSWPNFRSFLCPFFSKEYISGQNLVQEVAHTLRFDSVAHKTFLFVLLNACLYLSLTFYATYHLLAEMEKETVFEIEDKKI